MPATKSSKTAPQAQSTHLSDAPSLQRGLAVLEHLAQRPEGCTLSEISEWLELPQASAHRLCRTLEALGYVRRHEGSRRFTLTNRFLRIGQPRTLDRGLAECAMNAMRRVRQETGETTQLCCLVDVDMVIIEQLISLHPFKYSAEIGARCPCYSCAPGKAILAVMPDVERDATLSRLKLKRFTSATITTRKGLESELADIRAKGYALDRAEGMAGIHCVAAPILDANGHAIAAITIAGPQERVPESDFARVGSLMRVAAADVAFQFGGAAS